MVGEEDGITYITTERNWSKINHVSFDGMISSLTADEGSVDCMDKKNGRLVYVAMRKNWSSGAVHSRAWRRGLSDPNQRHGIGRQISGNTKDDSFYRYRWSGDRRMGA